ELESEIEAGLADRRDTVAQLPSVGDVVAARSDASLGVERAFRRAREAVGKIEPLRRAIERCVDRSVAILAGVDDTVAAARSYAELVCLVALRAFRADPERALDRV